jgi:hypothetical protein
VPSFTAVSEVPVPPEAVFAYMRDLSNWKRFGGYGPLPGIVEARLPEGETLALGARVRVSNTDGSVHHERVTVFEPPRRYRVRMELEKPASRVFAWIDEAIEVEPTSSGSRVRRRFTTRSRRWYVAPVAWLVTHLLLRPAVKRHDRAVADDLGARKEA